ncbi:hypothetical protein K458DRAFT_387225 [Lentithecium fluviatile CBS 122367]|uniref:2,6-dihydroxypyridine 3-monooxygenase substrate binding domain-containing protein n=1 Tax=Lentithecium fluviatile CBS 122367 TaxID=1168545 RepID=A0A6G1J6S7_9PLEO|nr:hypothetical protein K458DRAFT_387225 [Lentithecium fluviatile CBS 122367]
MEMPQNIVIEGPTQGQNVHVLEKSPPEFLQSQESRLEAGADVRKFIEQYINDPNPHATTLETIEFMNKGGEIYNKLPPADPYYLTTWSILMLKSALLKSKEGREYGLSDQQSCSEYTSLQRYNVVIAADGAYSTARKSLYPGIVPENAGYIRWRGAVSENAVPESTKKFSATELSRGWKKVSQYREYYVPGENGNQALGDCQFIWVWYEKLPEGRELQETLTDANSRHHFTTISRGKMRQEVWTNTLRRGRLLLGAPLSICSTVLGSVSSQQSDIAGLQIPSYIMENTNQVARQAIGLAHVLSWADWEKDSLDNANKYSAISDAFGEYCFTGVMSPLLRSIIPSEDGPAQ